MPSLDEERNRSDVDIDKLGSVIYGGSSRIAHLKRIWKIIEDDEEFSKDSRAFFNHSQRYVDACRKIKRFQEIVDAEGLRSHDEIYDAYISIDESLPLDVHLSMFIPIMKLHTSAAQRARWLKPATTFRIIGAYAQTELAHGSNIRGIETTSTYDRSTQEFVIHTPTLTSMKWWPGGLAHTATHAVVYANLIIDDKNYGPHPFMVQLRSLTNHRLLPGIETGDIGPKLGYNSMDNGYARFTNLRIPREDMLMGFAQVSPDGQYTKQEGAEKVAYGIMLDVRARICIHSAYVLARALTISIRYSLVREQGFLDSRALYPAEERSVMEYPTQQRVLMPLLALTYALHFTGQSVKALYTQYTKTHDLSVLSDLHATSAGLKAYMTTHVSEGVLACCKMCGGHGYLVSAGFTDLYTSYLPFCTLEGTREVLLQQTGRFLLKQRQLALSGRSSSQSQMSQTAAYLRGRVSNRPQQLKPVSMDGLKNYLRVVSQKQTITAAAFRDVALVILNLFRQRVALLVDAAALTVYQHSQRLGPNSSIADQLLAASVELCRAAEAHCELLILEAFYKRIVLLTAGDPPSSNAGVILPDLSPEMKSLREMFVLLAMTIMERHVGQYLLTGLLAPGDVQLISTAEFVLCSSLRVDSLNLIEGWLLSDKRIWSTLGRSDGNVYEALYEATKKEPLNETTVSDGYNLYLKHVIQKPYPDGSNGNIGAAKIVSRL